MPVVFSTTQKKDALEGAPLPVFLRTHAQGEIKHMVCSLPIYPCLSSVNQALCKDSIHSSYRLHNPEIHVLMSSCFPANCHNTTDDNKDRMQIPQKVKPAGYYYQSNQRHKRRDQIARQQHDT